jgi:hypothetical protein
MQSLADIPEHIIPYLKIILYFCFHISEVNEEKQSLARYLRPEYLTRVVGDQRAAFLEALSWAIEHPENPYREVLPDIRFSDEDCLKLLQIFFSHIKSLG